jgi:hypothetical protein
VKNESSSPNPFIGCIGLFFFTLTFFGLCGFAVYAILKLDSKIAAAFIAATGTVIVSVFTVTYGKYLENQAKIREEQRLKRVEIYDEFIEIVLGFFVNPTGEWRLTKYFQKFSRKLILWGSPDVIKCYLNFQNAGAEKDPLKRTKILGALLLEIRNDLGNSNEDLTEETILRMFITKSSPSLDSETQIQENPENDVEDA